MNRNRIRILKAIITVPGPAASIEVYCQWDATATTSGVLLMLSGRAWLCIINLIAVILIDIISYYYFISAIQTFIPQKNLKKSAASLFLPRFSAISTVRIDATEISTNFKSRYIKKSRQILKINIAS